MTLNIFKALKAGTKRDLRGLWQKVAAGIALFIMGFQVYVNIIGTWDPFIHAVVFMGLMLSLLFLLQSPSPKHSDALPIIDVFFCIFMLLFSLYMWLERERFITRFPLVDALNFLDISFGLVVVAAIFEAMRRTLGAGLTIVVTVILFYVFLGHFIEGPFYHRPIDLETFLDHLVFTINGVGGVPMRVAATYVFVFVTLGAFLEASGGGDFFYKFANSIAGGYAGGPAKVAVISSAAFGTISGSPTADVATTGAFTIPLMKRMGYSPIFAGAVETTASTGGALLPPIMGTAAFLMVEFTGTPYREIVIASVIPALIYYFGCFMQVHFRSLKENLIGLPREELPHFGDAFRDRGEFLVPLGLLIFLILKGYTPTLAGLVCLALTVPISWLRKDARMDVERILQTMLLSVNRLAPLIAACAAAGLVVGGLNITGLASKFITLIGTIAGGNALLALVLAAGVLLLLGMGMPLPVVYILGASLIAPVLTGVGIPTFRAHLFIVFYSALSAITPPVAVAAYTAAGIAGADPMAIGWQAVKLGVAGFVVPFVFAFYPAIMLQGSFLEILWITGTTILGILFWTAAVEGYFFWGKMGILPRLGLVLAGILLIIPGGKTDLIGLTIGIVLLLPKIKERGGKV